MGDLVEVPLAGRPLAFIIKVECHGTGLLVCPRHSLFDRDALQLIVIDNRSDIGFGGLVGVNAAIVVLDGFNDGVDSFPPVNAFPSINDVPNHASITIALPMQMAKTMSSSTHFPPFDGTIADPKGGLSALAPLSVIAAKRHGAAMIDIYESAVEVTGSFGAVFERDDETAFFYLLDMRKSEGRQIVSAFKVEKTDNSPSDMPVSVRWSEAAPIVGLFVNGALMAVFDLRSGDLKGRYAEDDDARWF